MKKPIRVQVTASELLSFLELYGADRVLVLGPPGVGKSETVRAYAEKRAKKLGLKLVDAREGDGENSYVFLHLFAPTLRPEDLAFIAKKGDRYDFVLPSYLEIFTKPGVKGLIFIDEITNVQLADVLTALFSLVLDKTLAGYKISENVEIIAAGNTPDQSSVANLLPRPLVDRVRMVIETAPPSVKEWQKYMEANYEYYDYRVLAFLLANPDVLYVESDAETLEKTPTPRTWTEFALLLAKTPVADNAMLHKLAVFALGKKIGTEFYEFLTTSINAEKLLKGDAEYFASLSIKERYIALYRVAKEILVNGKNACGFAKILSRNREYAVVAVKIMRAIDGRRAFKIIRECKEFRQAVIGAHDLLEEHGLI